MQYKMHLIRGSRKIMELRHANGNTADIIETVLYGDTKSAWYTKVFAPTLKGATVLSTCRNIWQFLKTQVPYVLDPAGEQYIKAPGVLVDDRAGDCKSFSVFAGSILQNLGIPYRFRFTSYDRNDSTKTHVYVVVDGPTEIIIDAVWTGPFNTQKPFFFVEDKRGGKGLVHGGGIKKVAGIGGIGSLIFKNQIVGVRA